MADLISAISVTNITPPVLINPQTQVNINQINILPVPEGARINGGLVDTIRQNTPEDTQPVISENRVLSLADIIRPSAPQAVEAQIITSTTINPNGNIIVETEEVQIEDLNEIIADEVINNINDLQDLVATEEVAVRQNLIVNNETPEITLPVNTARELEIDLSQLKALGSPVTELSKNISEETDEVRGVIASSSIGDSQNSPTNFNFFTTGNYYNALRFSESFVIRIPQEIVAIGPVSQDESNVASNQSGIFIQSNLKETSNDNEVEKAIYAYETTEAPFFTEPLSPLVA